MLGKQALKDYEFKTLEDYFNYIQDSYLNGNFSQVRSLFKKLSQEQKNQFIFYLQENTGEITINLLGYLITK